MVKSELKKYYFFAAIIDIAKLFAEQEIGTDVEVDIEMIASYVESFRFAVDYHDPNDKIACKEDMYAIVTDEIIKGLPIWQFLKLSDWTKDMLTKSFLNKIAEARKQYKCYTCQYFQESHTSLGVIEDCKRPINKSKRKDWRPQRKEGFIPVKQCKYYTVKA